jgi:predicted RNase H-related nuclease YkuK (DUF458 family)
MESGDKNNIENQEDSSNDFGRVIDSLHNKSKLSSLRTYQGDVAEYIKEMTGIKATFIDIDINPDKQFGSNVALSACTGMCSGYDYDFRHKGDNPQLTYASDSLVK